MDSIYLSLGIKHSIALMMYENDIKKLMLMSLQLQNSFQRKQAGSWKIHKCSVSVSCFVFGTAV